MFLGHAGVRHESTRNAKVIPPLVKFQFQLNGEFQAIAQQTNASTAQYLSAIYFVARNAYPQSTTTYASDEPK